MRLLVLELDLDLESPGSNQPCSFLGDTGSDTISHSNLYHRVVEEDKKHVYHSAVI